jgi:hypothetical protein
MVKRYKKVAVTEWLCGNEKEHPLGNHEELAR